MIVLLIEFFVLYCFFISGIFILKLVKKNNFKIEDYTFLYPLIGAIILMSITQILNIILPIKMIVLLIVPFLLFMCFNTKEEIKVIFSQKSYRTFWIIIILALMVFNIPLIFKGELASFQNSNNDILYYLSSMDWLKDHSWLDKIEYSSSRPYYAIGEYVLKNSRYGFDVIGSLFMTMSMLEAHQIFAPMGAVASVLVLCAFLYTSRNVFKISDNLAKLGIIILASGGQLTHLIASSYVPQIMGIAFMIAFIGVLNELYSYKDKSNRILFAIILSGTLAVYAEYALYLLVIYCIYAIVYFIYNKKSKVSDFGLLRAIQGGLISIIINPVAYIAGIHLNLKILSMANESLTNIDAYNGQLKNIWGIFIQLFGWVKVENIFKFHIPEIFYKGVILLFIICMIIGLIITFYKNKLLIEKSIILLITLFAIGYEISFRVISYGYGEYKHLTTFGPIILLFIFCIIKDINYKKTAFNFLFLGGCIASVFFNLGYIYTEYLPKYLYYFDKELLELRQGVSIVPNNEKIGILNTIAPFQHGCVYALKNQDVVLTGSGRSYFSLYIDTPETMEKYMIVPFSNDNIFTQDIFRVDADTIWHNDRFSIVRNNDNLFLYCEKGFSTLENTSEGEQFRWTDSNNSSIGINNLDGTSDKHIKIKFYAGDSPEGKKHLIVKCNGKKIASSTTGKYVTTDEIVIPKGTIIYIDFVTKEPLTKIETDDREFGFYIKDVEIINADEK